jgi:hypothetical protein
MLVRAKNFSPHTIDCRKAETDCRKAETDCRKAETDCRKAETDCRKVEIDCRKAEVDCRKAETDCRKAEVDCKYEMRLLDAVQIIKKTANDGTDIEYPKKHVSLRKK